MAKVSVREGTNYKIEYDDVTLKYALQGKGVGDVYYDLEIVDSVGDIWTKFDKLEHFSKNI